MSPFVFLTGATGFIGRHWAYELLVSEPELRVVALVRGSDHEAALERVRHSITRAALVRGRAISEHALSRVEVVLGDITLPRLGLDSAALGRLVAASVEEFWHFAATTEFDPAHAEQIAQTNFDGTLHALAVAQLLGSRRFLHMSSSYVCGLVSGDIEETLHPLTSPFANPYEISKSRAEHEVSARCSAVGLGYRIFRPSVVVGPESTGRADNARHGLYGFMHALAGAAPVIAEAGAPLRLECQAETPLNLVPVDTLVSAMARLRRQRLPKGPIYHITAGQSPTVETALATVCDALRLPHFVLSTEPVTAPTPLEAAVADATRKYAGYLKYPKRFRRSVGAHISVSEQDIVRFCAAWVAERELRAARKVQQPILGSGAPRASY